MGKLYDAIAPELADWLVRQRVFFVATAPRAADGLVNCSPKGMDTFRILGPQEVAYLDLTGSGIAGLCGPQCSLSRLSGRPRHRASADNENR